MKFQIAPEAMMSKYDPFFCQWKPSVLQDYDVLLTMHLSFKISTFRKGRKTQYAPAWSFDTLPKKWF